MKGPGCGQGDSQIKVASSAQCRTGIILVPSVLSSPDTDLPTVELVQEVVGRGRAILNTLFGTMSLLSGFPRDRSSRNSQLGSCADSLLQPMQP